MDEHRVPVAPGLKSGNRRGRPVDAVKREAMAEAARRLFVSGGYDTVTMEGVAAGAGVSKVTVYRSFGDRTRLIAHVVQSESERMASRLRSLQIAEKTLEETLIRFGVQFLRHLGNPEVRSFDLHMALQASKHPELVEAFFEAGPGRTRTLLAGVLRKQGLAPKKTCVELAEEMMAAWLGALPMELRFGLSDRLKDAEIERRVRRIVSRFLPELNLNR